MSMQVNVTTRVNESMIWAHAQATARVKQLEELLSKGAYEGNIQPSLLRHGDDLRKELAEVTAHRDTLAEVLHE